MTGQRWDYGGLFLVPSDVSAAGLSGHHADLNDVSANQHHNQAHTDSDHSDGANVKKTTPVIVANFSKAGSLALSSGAFRWYNDSGATLTIKKIRASVGTSPSGASILVDVNVDGTTIWATQGNRVAVAAAANTGSQTTFDTTTIADGHYLSFDIDQIGSGVAGADLTVQVWMSLA